MSERYDLPLPKSGLIIALDPGGTTGIAMKRHADETDFKLLQLGPDEHHTALWKLLATENPDVVVCERFDSMPLQDFAVNLAAREYIGVAKLYCQSTHKPFVSQQRSAAKGLWTDAKIKSINLWQPGQKHSMDALRHLLYYITVAQKDQRWVRALRRLEP